MTEPPSSIRPFVRGLHHVAIAVRSIEASRTLYEGLLGFQPGPREHVPEQKVEAVTYAIGGPCIELVEPAAEDAPIAGFLAKREGGLHHLAWLVDDADLAYRRCIEQGLQVIGDGPGPGAHGTRIFFLHPRCTGGVLHELVEDPSRPRSGGLGA